MLTRKGAFKTAHGLLRQGGLCKTQFKPDFWLLRPLVNVLIAVMSLPKFCTITATKKTIYWTSSRCVAHATGYVMLTQKDFCQP